VPQAITEHRTTSHLDHKRHVVFTMPSTLLGNTTFVICHAFFLRPVHEKRPHDHRPLRLYVYVLDHIWVWALRTVFIVLLDLYLLGCVFLFIPWTKNASSSRHQLFFGVVVDVLGLLPLNVIIQPLTRNLEVLLMSWVFSP